MSVLRSRVVMTVFIALVAMFGVFLAGRTLGEHRPLGSGSSLPIAESPECAGPLDFVGMHDAVSGQEVYVSNHLLAGDWVFEGRGFPPWGGAVDGVTGLRPRVVKTVLPGLYVLNFNLMVSNFDGAAFSCVQSYAVTGIAYGETFDLQGPCSVEVNQNVSYQLILRGDRDVYSAITFSDPSELYVRRKNSAGDFDLHRFIFQGDQLKDEGFVKGIGDGGAVDVTFLDPGIYDVEVVWRMPRHKMDPLTGDIIFTQTAPLELENFKVSAASIRVDVRPPGGTCEPAPGSRCEDFPTVSEYLEKIQAQGTIRCQPGGGFAAGPETISPSNIKNRILKLIAKDTGLSSSLSDDEKLDLASRLQTRYENCILQHEFEHVRFLSDPANGVGDVSDFCDDCCCDNTPTNFPDDVVVCTEKKAWAVSAGCFKRLWDESTKDDEKTVLQLAAKSHEKMADGLICP